MCLFDFFKQTDINQGVEEFRTTAGAALVDVRERDEYAEGHIEDAINLPLSEIGTAGAVLKDKEQPLFLYCLGGSRSGQAASALKRQGYTNVKNIGGISAYRGRIVT